MLRSSKNFPIVVVQNSVGTRWDDAMAVLWQQHFIFMMGPRLLFCPCVCIIVNGTPSSPPSSIFVGFGVAVVAVVVVSVGVKKP